MNAETYSWGTTHNDYEETMTHAFQHDVRCVVSWKHSTVTILLAERVVDVFPFPSADYTISRHVAVLVRIAEVAAESGAICPNLRRESKLKEIRRHVL
jgi:hypothetical protein